MAFFVYKLTPSRPTFAQDMTEAESQMIGTHVKYWSELANKGLAILFGPVLDPKGPWGLAVVEVHDQEEAKFLGLNDPAIKANVGFQFEIYPMPTAILRKQE